MRELSTGLRCVGALVDDALGLRLTASEYDGIPRRMHIVLPIYLYHFSIQSQLIYDTD